MRGSNNGEPVLLWLRARESIAQGQYVGTENLEWLDQRANGFLWLQQARAAFVSEQRICPLQLPLCQCQRRETVSSFFFDTTSRRAKATLVDLFLRERSHLSKLRRAEI
jgi:hypothetical protein